MKNKKHQAFTLVELIVVISILVILWTIGFISYTSYLLSARDSNRISQISWIYHWLEVVSVKQDIPSPVDRVEIKNGGTVIAYQWYVWQDILDMISYSKWGKDPKDSNFFSYYLTSDKKYFQIMWFLEDQSSELWLLWINHTYATSVDYTKRYPYIYGSKLWILTDITNTPIQEITSIKANWYADLSWLDANTKFIAHISDSKNYTFSGSILANKLYWLANPEIYWAPKGCPTGFIWAPWDPTFNQKWFCVAQYEMTYSNLSTNPSNDWWNTYPYTSAINITSKPWYPIASITQDQAITACRSMGNGYHLITNNEWMAIARNIEMEGKNWSWGTPWAGWVYRGISEELTYWCDGNPDWELGVPSNDTTCKRRVLTLSNGSQIWDLSWNVWEHVDRSNNSSITSAQVWNGDLCSASWYWYTNWNPATTCQAGYGSATYTKWWVDMGMGYVWNNTWTDKVFLRGAAAIHISYVGIFAIYLEWTPASQNMHVGFRCAY